MGRINELQKIIATWRTENFGPMTNETYIDQAFGIWEESGEFAHSLLKKKQGIRKDQNHDVNISDALGDMFVYMLNYCECTGRDLETVIEATITEVLKRTRKDQISRAPTEAMPVEKSWVKKLWFSEGTKF